MSMQDLTSPTCRSLGTPADNLWGSQGGGWTRRKGLRCGDLVFIGPRTWRPICGAVHPNRTDACGYRPTCDATAGRHEFRLPVASADELLTAGARGPILLYNLIERSPSSTGKAPERVVRARGYGAVGQVVITKNVRRYTKGRSPEAGHHHLRPAAVLHRI